LHWHLGIGASKTCDSTSASSGLPSMGDLACFFKELSACFHKSPGGVNSPLSSTRITWTITIIFPSLCTFTPCKLELFYWSVGYCPHSNLCSSQWWVSVARFLSSMYNESPYDMKSVPVIVSISFAVSPISTSLVLDTQSTGNECLKELLSIL
jgi:hypothetical protein